jgi:4'-phosphopantetheinyl transferase
MPLIKIENINTDCKWALWEINESLEELNLLLNLPSESEKYEKISHEEKRKETLASRILLKKLLESSGESYTGAAYDEYGKPFLPNSNHKISLSHTKGYAVAIIHKNAHIGIDIELIKEKVVKIASKVFSVQEIGKDLKNITRLCALWSIKEVLYKVYGKGDISLKNNIIIHPFIFNETEGECNAEIRTKEDVKPFKIKYLKFRECIIAFTLL